MAGLRRCQCGGSDEEGASSIDSASRSGSRSVVEPSMRHASEEHTRGRTTDWQGDGPVFRRAVTRLLRMRLLQYDVPGR